MKFLRPSRRARACRAVPVRAGPVRSRARHARRHQGLASGSRASILREPGSRPACRRRPPDEAAAAYRAALAAWPGAQSAQVALMTLSVVRGNGKKRGARRSHPDGAGRSRADPWWTYWLGDYRVLPRCSAARARTMMDIGRRDDRGGVGTDGHVALGQTPPTGQEPLPPVFRASADVVSVDAAVQRDRRPVTGLKPADFRAPRQRRSAGDLGGSTSGCRST